MTDQQQPDKPVTPDAPKPEQADATPKPSGTPPLPQAAPSPAPVEAASSAPKPTQPVDAPTVVKDAPPPAPVPAQPPAASSAPTAPKPAVPAPSPVPSTRDLRDIVRDISKDPTIPSKSSIIGQADAPKDGPPTAPPSPAKPAPADATAAAGTICPTCGHRNRPGELICDNCGTNLSTGSRATVGTRDLVREQEEREAEKPGEKVLDTSQFKAIETAGATSFTEDMVLRIEIEGGTTPMMVYPKQEIIMGRRDPNTGGMPDVDLTSYAGYRMGVSRRHAAVRLQEKQLHVSDLGSSNGTFLNGTRLSAHRPYQLRDGDEIRLGQMVLRVYFQSSKERK